MSLVVLLLFILFAFSVLDIFPCIFLVIFFHSLCFFCYSPMAVSYLLVRWIRTSLSDGRGEGLCYMHSCRRNRPFFCYCTFPSKKWALEKRNTSLEESEFCLKSQINCQKSQTQLFKNGLLALFMAKALLFWDIKKVFRDWWNQSVGIGFSPRGTLSVGEWTGHFVLSRKVWNFV